MENAKQISSSINNKDFKIYLEKLDNGHFINVFDTVKFRASKPVQVYQGFSEKAISNFANQAFPILEVGDNHILIEVFPYEEPFKIEWKEEKISEESWKAVIEQMKKENEELRQEIELEKKKRPFMGQTSPSDWEVYREDGIFVKVDISSLKLTKTPIIQTSLLGKLHHWQTTGATSIYEASNTSFMVFLRFACGEELTPEFAQEMGWYLQYVIYPQE